MDFAPKTQYDRTIKGAWKSAESNPKKHEEPKKYEEKEKTNMKKISRRDFLKASAFDGSIILCFRRKIHPQIFAFHLFYPYFSPRIQQSVHF